MNISFNFARLQYLPRDQSFISTFLLPPFPLFTSPPASPTPSPLHQPEDVDEKAAEVLPRGLMDQLANTNWKERLAACERFKEVRYTVNAFVCVEHLHMQTM